MKSDNSEPIEADFTERSVAVVQSAALPAMALDLSQPGALQKALDRADAMVDFKDQMIARCVKRAKPLDIVSLGGKPYFTEAFCEQLMARIGGGTIQILSKEWEPLDDGHFSCTVVVRVDMPGLGGSDGLGMATSKDSFLGETRSRTIDQVSRHNLLQHARTRAVGSALRKLLGLSSFSWDELKAWGFDQAKSSAVEYKKGGSSKPAPKSSGASSSGSGEATGKTKGRIVDFVNRKIFNFDQIGDVQKEIGLSDCRAMDLDEESMNKLADELVKREADLNG